MKIEDKDISIMFFALGCMILVKDMLNLSGVDLRDMNRSEKKFRRIITRMVESKNESKD